MSTDVLDVAIVGGGVSGTYCGWRLLGADAQDGAAPSPPSRRVALFEMSDRIGGRLLSATPPGMPKTVCELGGMRYITSQTLCRSLVENVFKLDYRPFPTGLPGNICLLRGTRLRFSELGDAGKVPYRLEGAETGQDPNTLLLMALRAIVPGVDSMTDDEFDEIYRTYKFEGRHLYEWGFWNLLLKVQSNEAYNLVRDSSGYYSITTNWNAADAIRMCLGDFRQGIAYRAVNDGFETVPKLLAESFEKAGGEIHRRHRLVSFDSTNLPDGSKGMKLEIESEAGRSTVLARNLVLAMPRRSLELIDQTGCFLSPENTEAHDLIKSVEGIPLFKLFVTYHSPWWEAVGVRMGESTTTLPLRQCYYWAVEGRQPGADPGNENSLLLASYEDVGETLFWRGLETQPAHAAELFEERHNPHIEPETSDHLQAWRDHQAPLQMVREAHRQLLILHGFRYAPEPYAAAFADWSIDPYGGGVHFWNIGYNSLECIKRMVRPVDDEPLYVVGEAYSQTQGWVEGALETSELMLRDFGIPAPSWTTQPHEGAVS